MGGSKSKTDPEQAAWAKATHKELMNKTQAERIVWINSANNDKLSLLAEHMNLGKTGNNDKHKQQIISRFAGSGSLRALLQAAPASESSQPAHQASPPVPPTAVPPPAVHQSTPSTALGSHSAPLIPSSPAARTGGSPVIAGRKKRKPRRRSVSECLACCYCMALTSSPVPTYSAKPVQAPATSADTSSSTGSASDTRASGKKRARSPAASDTENAVETSEGKAPKKTSRKHKACPYCEEPEPDGKHTYKCANNPANANVQCNYCDLKFSGFQARDLRSDHHSKKHRNESKKDIAAKAKADPTDQCIYCKRKFTGEDM